MEQIFQNGVINKIYQKENKLSQFFLLLSFLDDMNTLMVVYTKITSQNNITYVKQCKHAVITHKEMCKLISSVGRKYIHRTSKY